MKKLPFKIRARVRKYRDFLEEKGIGGAEWERSRSRRFAHFWLMVIKSFSRNRCPERAAALAYTSLLGIIPVFAVVLSVSTGLLKKDGEERILHFIDKFVASVTPPSETNTNSVREQSAPPTNSPSETAPNEADSPAGRATAQTNALAAAVAAETERKDIDRRKQLARTINQYIQNTRSNAIGVTGSILLIVVAIRMLSQIEQTFNDIWGVERGRSWFVRIIHYSAVLFWGPVMLGVALGLAGGRHFQMTKSLIGSMPYVGALLFQWLPVVVLCVAFAVFYMLIPNTKVRWQAALAGGLVGGGLWYLNNAFSIYYASRWITNSRIYGSLAVLPVFMVGLYFAWLIMLFGAQFAYAVQNRASYLQEKQIENINQRGREFIALRLMACVGSRFQRGERPATVPEISNQLAVPSRLVQQLMQILIAANLVAEVTGAEIAYVPARPIDTITCHDILLALRAGQGQELATKDEPARAEVYGEFKQILEAERKAASAVSVLMMVNRTEARAALAAREVKAMNDAPDVQT